MIAPSHHIRRLVVWDALYEQALYPSNMTPPEVSTPPARRRSDASVGFFLQPANTEDLPPAQAATAPASPTLEEVETRKPIDERNPTVIRIEHDAPLAHSVKLGKPGAVCGIRDGQLELPGVLSRSYSDLGHATWQTDGEEETPANLRVHTREHSDPQPYTRGIRLHVSF